MKKNSQRLLLFVALIIVFLFAMILTDYKQRSVAPIIQEMKLDIPCTTLETAKSGSGKLPDSINNTQELERFRHKIGTEGALAKLTVKVGDSMGRQVSGATVGVNFIFFNNNGPENIVTGLTDNNGLFVAEKKTTYQSRIWVEKNGYYKSSVDYMWNKGVTFETIKDGCWQPWNPTIEVVLKEKRNSLKGVVGRTDIKIPKDIIIGFDCVKGDWQPPVGQGVHADIMFLYRSDYNGTFGYLTNSLTISTQGSLDGFIKYKQDAFSKYWSIYDAPKNGYQPLLVFEQARTLYKMFKNTVLEDDKYLVFCSTRENEKKYYGKITNFEYGEDYKKKDHGFIKFKYYLNPTPNDRRLEIEK